ncbi:MAG: hypothetical protein ABUS79_06660 [Pseudomonadota bacterium]
MLMLGPAAVIVVALATPGAPGGRAPSPEEQRAFSEGLRLYEGGDPRGAERAWQDGYAAGRDPAFLVRIGEAQEKAGAPQEALRSYQLYLRESPDAADRADIEARVQRLAPPAAPRPGVEVESPGEMAAPGNAMTAPPAGRTVDRGAQLEDSDAHEDLLPLIEEQPPRSPLNVAGWVGAGATVLLLGVAAFYGAKAAEKAGDANRLLLYFDEATGVPQEYGPRAREYEELVREGRRDDHIATGMVIAAGATAVASAILFIVDATSDGSADKRPAAGSHQAGSPGRRPAVTVRSTRGGLRGLDLALDLTWRF